VVHGRKVDVSSSIMLMTDLNKTDESYAPYKSGGGRGSMKASARSTCLASPKTAPQNSPRTFLSSFYTALSNSSERNRKKSHFLNPLCYLSASKCNTNKTSLAPLLVFLNTSPTPCMHRQTSCTISTALGRSDSSITTRFRMPT